MSCRRAADEGPCARPSGSSSNRCSRSPHDDREEPRHLTGSLRQPPPPQPRDDSEAEESKNGPPDTRGGVDLHQVEDATDPVADRPPSPMRLRMHPELFSQGSQYDPTVDFAAWLSQQQPGDCFSLRNSRMNDDLHPQSKLGVPPVHARGARGLPVEVEVVFGARGHPVEVVFDDLVQEEVDKPSADLVQEEVDKPSGDLVQEELVEPYEPSGDLVQEELVEPSGDLVQEVDEPDEPSGDLEDMHDARNLLFSPGLLTLGQIKISKAHAGAGQQEDIQVQDSAAGADMETEEVSDFTTKLEEVHGHSAKTYKMKDPDGADQQEDGQVRDSAAQDCAGADMKPREVYDRTTKLEVVNSHSAKIDKMKDPLYVYLNYTWGIHNNDLTCMVLLVVAFNALMPLLPLPEFSIDDPIAIVWRTSFAICTQIFMLVMLMRTKTGIADVFFRVFFGPLLGVAATSFVSPLAGMAIAHLSTACAAGMFGHSLAEYRLHIGTEQATSVAVALNSSGLSKRDRTQRMNGQIYTVFHSSIVIISLLGLMVWLVSVPAYDHIYFVVWAESIIIWWIMCFALLMLSPFLLDRSLISERIIVYYLVSFPVSLPFALFSHFLWAYFFALEMMIISAYFGYMLSIYSHYRELVPTDDQQGKEKKMLMARRVSVCLPYKKDHTERDGVTDSPTADIDQDASDGRKVMNASDVGAAESATGMENITNPTATSTLVTRDADADIRKVMDDTASFTRVPECLYKESVPGGAASTPRTRNVLGSRVLEDYDESGDGMKDPDADIVEEKNDDAAVARASRTDLVKAKDPTAVGKAETEMAADASKLFFSSKSKATKRKGPNVVGSNFRGWRLWRC